jgi:hypothetical protein
MSRREQIKMDDAEVAAFLAGERTVTCATVGLRVIEHAQPPRHLLLGAGAAQMAIDYSGCQLDEATAWQEVSASADFDAPYPVELPAPR